MALMISWLVTDIVFAVAVILTLSSLYYAHAFSYWRKRGIRYVEPILFFGNFAGVALQRESAGECLRKMYEKGVGQPLVGMYAFSKPQLVIRDLDLVQSVLVKDAHAFLDKDPSPMGNVSQLLSRSLLVLKGHSWMHARMKLVAAFTPGRMNNMFPLINKQNKKLVRFISQEISKGKAIDMKDTISRYSTDVIASCAFGVDTNALTDQNCEFHRAMRVFQPGAFQRTILVLSLCLPWILPVLRAIVSLDKVDEFIRKTFWDVVKHRKKSRMDRNDFVDLLMQIRDNGEVQLEDSKGLEEIEQCINYMNIEYSKNHVSDFQLDDDDIVAQAFIFALVGSGTSASVITLALFELAHHPAVQDRLRDEMNKVLGRHGSRLTHDSVSEMHYLHAVLSETMRKYPPLAALERKCVSDFKVPGTNITIEKGTPVMISLLGIHSDPKIYPNPDKFDPERFNIENRRKRTRFAHLPFGEGPRMCIGMRFAHMHVKSALIHILTTFKVWPCRHTPRRPLSVKAFLGPLFPSKKVILAFTELK